MCLATATNSFKISYIHRISPPESKRENRLKPIKKITRYQFFLMLEYATKGTFSTFWRRKGQNTPDVTMLAVLDRVSMIGWWRWPWHFNLILSYLTTCKLAKELTALFETFWERSPWTLPFIFILHLFTSNATSWLRGYSCPVTEARGLYYILMTDVIAIAM